MTARATRVIPIVLCVALVGCGAAYDEGPGAATAGTSVAASAEVEQQTAQAQSSDEVVIGAEEDIYEDTDPTALTEFRTTLDPYGTWVDDEVYGTVWVPSVTVVGVDFAPYVTAGHWVYEDEYIWVSDYDWGWVPFHYGRWVWIAGRGWAWIPGRRYAGAWVTWRVGYDGFAYVGWGPLPPTWYWRGGIAYGLGWYPQVSYVFCAHEHIFAPSVSVHIVTGARVQEIGAHTRPYTPAQPGVAAGGRTVAEPSVGGHALGGPPPQQLGIMNAPRLSQNAGIMRAQQYARPSSATQIGARPPMLTSRAPDALGRSTIGSTTAPHSNNPMVPSVRPPPQSLSRPSPFGAPKSDTQAQTFSRPQPMPQMQPLPQAQPQPLPRPQVSQPYTSMPSYSAPQYQAPRFQSAPQPSAPQYSAPQYQAPRVQSAPVTTPRFTSPSVQSAPRVSTPSVSQPSRPSVHVGGAVRRR